MKDCLIVLAIVLGISTVALYAADAIDRVDMAASNPCRQGHSMPNECLVVAVSKR